MPQINQLSDVLLSQLFWLGLTLAVIYFGIGKAMLPKILSTIDSRERSVAADLAAAEAARAEADATEEAWRTRMNEGRAEAIKITAESRAAGARASEGRVGEADKGIGARLADAETRIAEQSRSALADIDTVAAEAARDLVARLARLKVSAAEAQKAVKAQAAHG